MGTHPQTSILLIDCPDEKGLVHKISGVLFHHNYNMVGNREFVDREAGHFFMRTEVVGEFIIEEIVQELKEQLPSTANIRVASKEKKDIVILATKEYHCIGDLLMRHQFGDLNANIKAVVSNHDSLKELTEKFNIPYHFISHKDFEDRTAHEHAVLEAIKSYSPEYLVLAKYMRILTPNFVANFGNQIVNIHHSFLPAFIGANPYRQAYNRGVKIIGATAHFVSNDLDEGPIITQSTVEVDHSRSVKDMARAGRDVEKFVLAQALKLVFEDRVFVHGNKTIVFD